MAEEDAPWSGAAFGAAAAAEDERVAGEDGVVAVANRSNIILLKSSSKVYRLILNITYTGRTPHSATGMLIHPLLLVVRSSSSSVFLTFFLLWCV